VQIGSHPRPEAGENDDKQGTQDLSHFSTRLVVFSAAPEDAWRNAFITAGDFIWANTTPLRKPPGPAPTYGFFGGAPTTFTTIPKQAHQLEMPMVRLAPVNPANAKPTL
jgi:hypothetical protein